MTTGLSGSEARGHIVDMHIHRLRQKIDDGFECRLIHAVAGAGYTVREAEPATLPAWSGARVNPIS